MAVVWVGVVGLFGSVVVLMTVLTGDDLILRLYSYYKYVSIISKHGTMRRDCELIFSPLNFTIRTISNRNFRFSSFRTGSIFLSKTDCSLSMELCTVVVMPIVIPIALSIVGQRLFSKLYGMDKIKSPREQS